MTDEANQRMVTPSDERQHRAEGTSIWWGESFGFDFATHTADGNAIGGFTRIVVYPRQRKCWFWAGIVGEDRRYVLCRDHDLTMPTTSVLELRGESLWTHMICETPLEHWTVAMEAYALVFDDPFEAWRTEHGERVGLAFDLEWESVSTAGIMIPSAHVHSTRYDVPCEVNGILQVGEEEWTLAATGSRHHEWGILDWSTVGAYRRSNGLNSGDLNYGATRLVAERTLAQAPVQIETPIGVSKRLLFTLEQDTSDPSPALNWIEELGEH